MSCGIDDAVLFKSGQRYLQPEAAPILKKVAAMIRPLPLNLKIEGHTDDLGDEMNNWDLSVNRAVVVLRFFATNQLVPLSRMSATGYGSQKPLFPNTSERERALNRRVEFVLESQGRSKSGTPLFIGCKRSVSILNSLAEI